MAVTISCAAYHPDKRKHKRLLKLFIKNFEFFFWDQHVVRFVGSNLNIVWRFSGFLDCEFPWFFWKLMQLYSLDFWKLMQLYSLGFFGNWCSCIHLAFLEIDAVVFTWHFWKLMQLYSLDFFGNWSSCIHLAFLEIEALVFTRNFWKLKQFYSRRVFGNWCSKNSQCPRPLFPKPKKKN